MTKSGKKSGQFEPGVDPRRGRGPAKGAENAGRPPDEFKRRMRAIASRDETLDYLEELTRRPRGRGKKKILGADPMTFLKAFRETADRGYGKAIQPLEHAGPDGGPIPIGDPSALRDFLARELAGIRERGDATPASGKADG